jgi:hypothetical protein
MKKLVLALVMMASVSYSQAQTIGDHLNYIRKEKPSGTLDAGTKPYTYSYYDEEVSSVMMYFLDENLICDRIVISPKTDSSRQKWVISFNDGWIVSNSTMWRFYKSDGMILLCTIHHINDVGMVFFIKEEKVEN